jgi:hypothetical protein
MWNAVRGLDSIRRKGQQHEPVCVRWRWQMVGQSSALTTVLLCTRTRDNLPLFCHSYKISSCRPNSNHRLQQARVSCSRGDFLATHSRRFTSRDIGGHLAIVHCAVGPSFLVFNQVRHHHSPTVLIHRTHIQIRVSKIYRLSSF